jgi:hypothetical protein
MAEDLRQTAAEAADDARLRALFQAAPRPPMGDEHFTRAIMAQVNARQGWARQWRLAGLAGAGSVAAALLVPHLGAGAGEIFASLWAVGEQIPYVGANGVAVIGLALACAAGWAVAERA